jgi:hypothetical protein
MPESKIVKLILPTEDTELLVLEAEDRGYLSHVVVEIDGSRLYPVVFITISRLSDDLKFNVNNGQSYFAETGMIVLQSITLESMQFAAVQLFSEGYFDYMIPLTRDRISRADPGIWPP